VSKLKPGMIEREHHAWGALLDYVETFAIAYRYDRYSKSSKTGKKFDRLLRATRALRERLNFEYGFVASLHLISEDGRANAEYWKARKAATTSDVYRGGAIEGLWQHVVLDLEDSPPDRILKCLDWIAKNANSTTSRSVSSSCERSRNRSTLPAVRQ
jgi:hypothetical protein